jgi:hypothetical protein
VPQRQAPRTTSRRPAVIGLVALLVVGAGAAVAPHFWQVGRTVGPACAIGINDTTASVTVRGWTAPIACESITKQLAAATHGLSAAVLVSRPVGEVAGPAICQGIVAHDLITVHDGGPLKLVGSLLCAAVQRPA